MTDFALGDIFFADLAVDDASPFTLVEHAPSGAVVQNVVPASPYTAAVTTWAPLAQIGTSILVLGKDSTGSFGIIKLAPDGTPSDFIPNASLSGYLGNNLRMFVDSANRIYVTNLEKVRRFLQDGSIDKSFIYQAVTDAQWTSPTTTAFTAISPNGQYVYSVQNATDVGDDLGNGQVNHSQLYRWDTTDLTATTATPSGGTGYTVGDVLTVVGGTGTAAATFTVAAVSGTGAPTSVSLTSAGQYADFPPGSVATTGGTGTGVTLTLGAPLMASHLVHDYIATFGFTVSPPDPHHYDDGSFSEERIQDGIGCDPATGDLYCAITLETQSTFPFHYTHGLFIDHYRADGTLVARVDVAAAIPAGTWSPDISGNTAGRLTAPNFAFDRNGGQRIWNWAWNKPTASATPSTVWLISLDPATGDITTAPDWTLTTGDNQDAFALFVLNPSGFPGLALYPGAGLAASWGPAL